MFLLYTTLGFIAFVVFFIVVVRVNTVFEYQRGLRYNRGRFSRVLTPGQYWYVPLFTTITYVDVRTRYVSITGQEVLSADGVSIKVSLAASYDIVDLPAATHNVTDYNQALYTELQVSLREILGSADIDTILQDRHTITTRLQQMCEPKAAAFGLKLNSVSLKDIMFPGKLKEMFAQVVNAKKEGLAALEKARGETAALRHLANTARLIDDNPNLLQLRLLQSIGESSGNTIMLGMPGNTVPIPASGRTVNEKKSTNLKPDEPNPSEE